MPDIQGWKRCHEITMAIAKAVWQDGKWYLQEFDCEECTMFRFLLCCCKSGKVVNMPLRNLISL